MRRITLIVIGLVLILGFVAGGVVLFNRHAATGSAEPAAPVPAKGIVVRGADPDEHANIDQVIQLLKHLPGALTAGESRVVAQGGAVPSEPLNTLLPAGAQITPQPASWHRTGAVGSMDITMTTPSGSRTDYLVILLNEAGSWRISQTYAVSGS